MMTLSSLQGTLATPKRTSYRLKCFKLEIRHPLDTAFPVLSSPLSCPSPMLGICPVNEHLSLQALSVLPQPDMSRTVPLNFERVRAWRNPSIFISASPHLSSLPLPINCRPGQPKEKTKSLRCSNHIIVQCLPKTSDDASRLWVCYENIRDWVKQRFWSFLKVENLRGIACFHIWLAPNIATSVTTSLLHG